jgi:DNA-binding MarR family transcriptional regulator
MSPSLQDELKQHRPWSSLEEEAVLSVARTAAILERAAAQLLKPHGITPTQYNVLRILRGAGDLGLCRHEVGERLIRQVPDVTRLLDRMEQAGLIERHRSGEDRRFVTTRITPKGSDLLVSLDAEVQALHRDLLAHVDATRLQALVSLLEIVRERA